jgi:peptidoglycan hydrolase-like protein with peptidoglycan-binding domain
MATTWRDTCTRRILGGDAGPFLGGPTKIVLHSTETGLGVPGYQGGSVAPHETWVWQPAAGRFAKYQHVSHARSAMAMKNLSGGVQTNRDGAHQVEIAGSCDKGFAAKYGYPYLPGMGDDFLRALGHEVRQLAADVNCKLEAIREWVDYPRSYGKGPSRMTLSEWDNFGGICGHQHAAENTHGDPGSLNVARALELSGAVVVVDKPTPVKPGGDSVLTKIVAPRFPLPKGHYFGPKSGPVESHSGFYGAADRAGLRMWQAAMRKRGWTIDVDGLWGAQTEKVVRVFQQRLGVTVTGHIGPHVWAQAWKAKAGVGT